MMKPQWHSVEIEGREVQLDHRVPVCCERSALRCYESESDSRTGLAGTISHAPSLGTSTGGVAGGVLVTVDLVVTAAVAPTALAVAGTRRRGAAVHGSHDRGGDGDEEDDAEDRDLHCWRGLGKGLWRAENVWRGRCDRGYIRVGGSAKTYWKHIQRGLEIANEDPTALLVFSGGQTRPQSLQTEAESYFSLAVSSGEKLPTLPHVDQAKAISHDSIGAENESTGDQAVVGTGAHANAAVATHNAPLGLQGLRMTTENYALDSFQNLLFSFARFREYTGHYPERITVVGYNVKRARFEELHAKAIRWSTKAMWSSKKRWTYVGIDDEGISAAAAKLQGDGEYLRGYSWFSKDMYGCHGNLLEKRKKRNPTRRFHPYFTSTPEIADLLDWCPAPDSGLQGIYRGSLPWDPRVSGPDGGWGRGAVQYKEELKQNGWRPLGGGPDSKKEWFSWVQVGPERPYK